MDIMNRDSNVLNPACDMVYLYNIDIRLDVLTYVSWSIRDLEAKVCRMGWIHWTILVAK